VLRQIRAWQFVGTTPGRELGPLGEVNGEVVRILRASEAPGEPRAECSDGSICIVARE